MIRSLGTALSLASLAILAVCLFVAHALTLQMEQVYVEPIFQTMDRIELEDAQVAFERQGRPALRMYLQRLDRQFGGHHFLLDARGADLDTGQIRSAVLPRPPATHSRSMHKGDFMVTQTSDDGRYWFVATKHYTSERGSFARLYVLVTGVVLAMGIFATTYIVLPLRRMARVVERLGAGDLRARMNTKRRDEVGALARSCNTMADRLDTAFRRERQLLQDVSHELRAPLARLNFSTRFARTAEDRDAALNEVKRDLDRLTFLVSELTALSVSPPGGGTGAEDSVLNLELAMQRVMRDARLEASVKGCEITFRGTAERPIRGEEEALRRAIENVVRNAIRHAPHGTAIEVMLAQTEHGSSIAVRDFGEGVPEYLLGRIFDPFFQVNPARSASQQNLGLGLSIARRSVELYGGSIAAENAHPGLRVCLELPFAQEEAEFAGKSATPRGNSALPW